MTNEQRDLTIQVISNAVDMAAFQPVIDLLQPPFDYKPESDSQPRLWSVTMESKVWGPRGGGGIWSDPAVLILIPFTVAASAFAQGFFSAAGKAAWDRVSQAIGKMYEGIRTRANEEYKQAEHEPLIIQMEPEEGFWTMFIFPTGLTAEQAGEATQEFRNRFEDLDRRPLRPTGRAVFFVWDGASASWERNTKLENDLYEMDDFWEAQNRKQPE